MGMAVKGSRWPPKRRKVPLRRVTQLRGCDAVRGRLRGVSQVLHGERTGPSIPLGCFQTRLDPSHFASNWGPRDMKL